MKRGKILVIVAPSGTGKSTLIEKLQKEFSTLEWSTSCTTRPRRNGEVEGQDYFFITEKEFITRRDNNEFIEWAMVHSNYYGTLKSFVDEGLKNGKHLLFDVDVQGCDAIKAIYGDEAKVIFIEPPSIEVLEERLKKRATDKEEVIQERLGNAKKELKRSQDYDYNVLNDDFNHAYNQLKEVFAEILES